MCTAGPPLPCGSGRQNTSWCATPEPSIYVYTQTFKVPGDAAGATGERRGFIALGQVEDYDRKVVFRHEQTLSKPKADRLNLLRATQAHCGQIFMVYSDPAGEVDEALAPERASDRRGARPIRCDSPDVESLRSRRHSRRCRRRWLTKS